MKNKFTPSRLAFAASLLMASPAFAVGTGTISSGAGSINKQGATTNVQQDSSKMVIDWDNMDVKRNETLKFLQPHNEASVLNRVHSADPTQILGKLNANGNVFIVNSNGVLIGDGASVNVGKLVASSLDISTDDFNADRMRFTGGGKGSVINEGTINAQDVVAMIGGGEVNNKGEIHAGNGVALTSGGDVTLKFNRSGGLAVRIDKGSLAALVENGGLIVAPGQIKLTAWAIDALTRNVVNNTGRIEADTLSHSGDGTISLESVGSGTVGIGGKLDGRIMASGDNIHVRDGAVLDAIGATTSASPGSIDLRANAENGRVEIGGSTLRADRVNIRADNVVASNGESLPRFEGGQEGRGPQLSVTTGTDDHGFRVGGSPAGIDEPDRKTGMINDAFLEASSKSDALLDVGTRLGDITVDSPDVGYRSLKLRSDAGSVRLNSKLSGGRLGVSAGKHIEQASGADIDFTGAVELTAGDRMTQLANVSGNAVSLQADNQLVSGQGTTTKGATVDYSGGDIRLDGNVEVSQLSLRAETVAQHSGSTITASELRSSAGKLDLSQGNNKIDLMNLAGGSAKVNVASDTVIDEAHLADDLVVNTNKNIAVGSIDTGGNINLSGAGIRRTSWLGVGYPVQLNARGNIDVAARDSVDIGGVQSIGSTSVTAGKKASIGSLWTRGDATVKAGDAGIVLDGPVQVGQDLTLQTSGNVIKGDYDTVRVGRDLTYRLSQGSKVVHRDGSQVRVSVQGKITDSRDSTPPPGDRPPAEDHPPAEDDKLSPAERWTKARVQHEQTVAASRLSFEEAMAKARAVLQEGLAEAPNDDARSRLRGAYFQSLVTANTAMNKAIEVADMALDQARQAFIASFRQAPTLSASRY
ncbi:two-partner secretion domain-containing protein [Burkholderia cenocepacia]|uniref:two-partner secretion domain-containing protein n=1 Tax=Burkholderia cenocepacia TaxID=95486 RepID=UPI001B9377F5|nr:filamentous hemagglutinin N-terminal domain-containing protein [Burkholderia cenocepacia]MBR8409072.1 filamentous hemagglutinin N-terminal domain-containing protein [Burkholderia cenocepacia]